MSTRGVVGFVLDGKWYVTYNHFDSYPEYLGMRVLEFCKQVSNWDQLKENVKGVTLVDENEKPTKEQADLYMRYHENPNETLHGVKDNEIPDWYWLLRSLQGELILYEIEKGYVKHMLDNHGFMGDSLFCEWGYIIDLDEEVLRVYKDGQKLLYSYGLDKLPEFMLGVTNEFKKSYRLNKNK